MTDAEDAEIIKVVYGIDRNYVLPAAVSIYSLCEHSTSPLEIVVYGDEFRQSDYETFLKIGKEFGVSINVQRYNSVNVKELKQKLRAHWPAILALRLELSWLVRGRCLYIDADTLIVRDVKQLMEIDLHGMPLGACMDPAVYNSWNQHKTTWKRLIRIGLKDFLRPKFSRQRRELELNRVISMGLCPNDFYFNAGVLVMNCDSIRTLSPPNRRLPLNNLRGLEPYNSSCVDQDRLNEFFAGRCCKLPLRWNLFPMAQSRHLRNWPDDARQEFMDALAEPGIWHFMGGGQKKPWNQLQKSRLKRVHHPAFQAWHNSYDKLQKICNLESLNV